MLVGFRPVTRWYRISHRSWTIAMSTHTATIIDGTAVAKYVFSKIAVIAQP